MRPDGDIVMCWDGRTETAELIIVGMRLVGSPDDVQTAFDTLNQWRNKLNQSQKLLGHVQQELEKLEDVIRYGKLKR